MTALAIGTFRDVGFKGVDLSAAGGLRYKANHVVTDVERDQVKEDKFARLAGQA
jgi:hypothetical protein